MWYWFLYKNRSIYNRIIFLFHKVIDTKHIGLVIKTWMLYLTFVRMPIGVNKNISISKISNLQDSYHQISWYQYLESSSYFVKTWGPHDVDVGLKTHDYGYASKFVLSACDNILPIWYLLSRTWFSLCSWFPWISTFLLGSLSKERFSMEIMDFYISFLFSFILFCISSLFSFIFIFIHFLFSFISFSLFILFLCSFLRLTISSSNFSMPLLF